MAAAGYDISASASSASSAATGATKFGAVTVNGSNTLNIVLVAALALVVFFFLKKGK